MKNPLSLQEKKKHGEIRFPFNIYPCTIPGDFPQVALHWHDSMELVFVKRGHGFVQMGVTVCRAQEGDIFIFSPGTLHAFRQEKGSSMEYENIIFDLELLGIPRPPFQTPRPTDTAPCAVRPARPAPRRRRRYSGVFPGPLPPNPSIRKGKSEADLTLSQSFLFLP